MATLKIEIELSDDMIDPPAAHLRALAERITTEGLPTLGAYLLRDITGEPLGYASVVTTADKL